MHARSAVYRLTIEHNAALTFLANAIFIPQPHHGNLLCPLKYSNTQHPSVYIVSYAEGTTAPELQQVQVLIRRLL